jgi:hypothetical protein
MQGIYRSTSNDKHVVLTLYERMMQPNASLVGQSDGRSCSDTSSVSQRDVRASAQAVEIIGPSLHHLTSLIETLCAIVGSTNLVPLRVSELQLDEIRMPALLVQQRTRMLRKPCPVIS